MPTRARNPVEQHFRQLCRLVKVLERQLAGGDQSADKARWMRADLDALEWFLSEAIRHDMALMPVLRAAEAAVEDLFSQGPIVHDRGSR